MQSAALSIIETALPTIEMALPIMDTLIHGHYAHHRHRALRLLQVFGFLEPKEH